MSRQIHKGRSNNDCPNPFYSRHFSVKLDIDGIGNPSLKFLKMTSLRKDNKLLCRWVFRNFTGKKGKDKWNEHKNVKFFFRIYR